MILGGRESLVRVRASRTLDPYSRREDQPDWDNADRRRIHNVAAADETSPETLGRKQQTTHVMTFIAQGFPDVTVRDRLEWRGETFEVVERPRRAYDGIAQTVIAAHRVEG